MNIFRTPKLDGSFCILNSGEKGYLRWDNSPGMAKKKAHFSASSHEVWVSSHRLCLSGRQVKKAR